VSERRLPSLRDPDTIRELIHKLREGIYITNAEGTILDANPAFLEMFGAASLGGLRAGSAAELLVDPAVREAEVAILHREGTVRDYELQIRRGDGELRTVLDTCSVLRQRETGEVFFLGMLVDITRHKQLEAQLRELSRRDPLTWTYNRHYLAELEHLYEADQNAWGAIVVDIDRFKDYNDLWGHEAGDQVLIKVSRFLLGRVRAEDAVIRFGGDEFLVLIPGEHAGSTGEVADRLAKSAGGSAPVPFSLGWAVREGGETVQQTIARADQQLIHVRVKERRGRQRRAGIHRPGHD
jgi:diguanylate cyclase (GGDEF)-like protein/PAS domain S-box-containing protein